MVCWVGVVGVDEDVGSDGGEGELADASVDFCDGYVIF